MIQEMTGEQKMLDGWAGHLERIMKSEASYQNFAYNYTGEHGFSRLAPNGYIPVNRHVPKEYESQIDTILLAKFNRQIFINKPIDTIPGNFDKT